MIIKVILNLPPELNRIGEFYDEKAEKDYFSKYIESSRSLLSVFLIIIPVGHILMLSLNYYSMRFTSDFILNVIMRLFLIIPYLIFFIYSLLSSNIARLNKLLVIFTIFLAVHYQLIVIVNRNTSFSQQAMSFFLLVISISMVPTRWIYCFSISIATTLSFFACFYMFFEPEYLYQYVRYIVYFGLGLFISNYFSYSLNVYRRLQYEHENHLKSLSYTDSLTKIYNRQYLNDNLMHWINKAEDGSIFSLIMFDLDDFKKLNDTYGHNIGDIILIEVSRIVKDNLHENAILSRWGGEEFMILIPDLGHKKSLETAQVLCNKIEHIFKNKYCVTASFGVKTYCEGDTIEVMLNQVDSKMYLAKKRGKNQVVS